MATPISPSPKDGGQILPVTPAPGPIVVPPKHEPEKPRRTGLWGTLIVVALLAGGAAFYMKNQSASRTAGGGPIVSVPTIAVSMGHVAATVRVNGTVAAQNFAALLAPRVMGSRTGMNRGGDAGFGGRAGGGGD